MQPQLGRKTDDEAIPLLIHHLTVALRASRRTPFTSAVTVLTLAAGLFCFLVAYAYVHYWGSAERHFTNVDRTYVLTASVRLRELDYVSDAEVQVSPRAAELIRLDFPELEHVARASRYFSDVILSTDGHGHRATALGADADFLRIFDFPFLSGSPTGALDTPGSAVLTASFAQRLFGERDALGRRLLLQNELEVTVTGIIDAVLEPSHLGRSPQALLPFDVLTSHDVYDALHNLPAEGDPNWLSTRSVTYLLLPGDRTLSSEALSTRLADFAERHIPAETRQFAHLQLGLIPVTRLLRKNVDESLFPETATVSVSIVLWLLGGLILAVACINYANLSIARSGRRMREAGLRKALGAIRRQVIAQHLVESGLFVLLALVIAIAGFRAAGPLLTAMAGVDPHPTLFQDAASVPFVILAAVAVTLAAGAYPAFLMSRLPPLNAMRASRQGLGRQALALSMVGAQFAVAAFLLIAVSVVWQQNTALGRTGLGGTGDPLLMIEHQGSQTGIGFDVVRAELARVPQVKSITGIDSAPWLDMSAMLIRTVPDPAGAAGVVFTRAVGASFMSVFDIPLLDGRALSPAFAEDLPPVDWPEPPGQPRSVVVDRAFVDQFGYASPADAIGQTIYSSFGPDAPMMQFRIVGVVERTAWWLLSTWNAQGMMYLLDPEPAYLVARIAADDVAGALAAIDATWERLAPHVPIERRFLDEIFDEALRTYTRISQVINLLAVIGVLIAFSGLVAMASLIASRRKREVAIRKTQGARTGEMVALLLASFTRPVLIANAIAWPLAYIGARAYLEMFLDPISLTPLPFLLCLVVTLAIACAASAGQTIRAARAMPAEVLRYE